MNIIATSDDLPIDLVGIFTDARYRFNQFSTTRGIIGIDHIAFAIKNERQLGLAQDALIRCGAEIIYSTHKWPKRPVHTSQSIDDQKFIFALRYTNTVIVGVSPATQGDQIDKFLGCSSTPKLHHLAMLVTSIRDTLNQLTISNGFTPIGNINTTSDGLSQIFMKQPHGDSIIELVQRDNTQSWMLNDNNIASLTASLRAHG